MKASTESLIVCFALLIMRLVLDSPPLAILSMLVYPSYFICRAIEDKK